MKSSCGVEWQTVDDLVGTVLERMSERLSGHTVDVKLPTDLPAVSVDGPLITQVFTNLLDNATKHTPAGNAHSASARRPRGKRCG